MPVYVLLRMSVTGRDIERIEDVFEDLDYAQLRADKRAEKHVRSAYKNVGNLTVRFEWRESEGVYSQRCHHEWDYQGQHHTLDFDNMYTIESFEVRQWGR